MGILVGKIQGLVVTLGALACLFLAPASLAGAVAAFPLQEQKVKAGLMYNFLKYTEWQDQQKGRRLRVCLIGGDPFEGYLHPLQGRTAQQQVIDIRPMDSLGPQVRSCSVAVIHRNLENRLPPILKSLARYDILTVSDIEGFSRRGGIVEMNLGDDQRVHIYVNRKNLEASGLNVKSRLLKLAELVE